MKIKKNRKRYTAGFKDDVVNMVLEQGYSCAEVGRRLDINPNNISRWIRKIRDQQEDVGQKAPSLKELQADNRRLRKESKRLQMEREILKKAAAFFANESS